MKKIISAAAALCLTVSAYAQDGITVSVDGTDLSFDQPPVIDNSRTLVPMRAIFEALGAEVDWNGETRTVISKKGGIEISLTVDTDQMKVGEETVTLDVPARIINDRTMVPVRAISEAMNCTVDWNSDTRSVIITTDTTADAKPETDAAASEKPEQTAEPSAEPTKAPFAAAVKTDIPDDTNIFDTGWIIEGKELDAASGKEKENVQFCVSDYIPVNEGKSYYAGYYSQNDLKFQAGLCMNYAFYDADKKYISGAAADMANTVKAPESASFVRFTIKLAPSSKRAKLYLSFMQTDKAPQTFLKSEAVSALAETDKFKGKRIFIVGDAQVRYSDTWLTEVDTRLGSEVIAIKGNNSISFTIINDRIPSFCLDKTTNTFPKNMDYMIIQSGLYEWMESRGMGSEISSSGGIYDFIASSRQKWPNTKLVFLTIPPAKYAADGFTGGGEFNKRGMSTADYSNEIIEACEKENIDVIDISDLWSISEIAKYMKADNLNYLYPNEEGGKLIAQRICERMVEIAGE